MRNLQPPIELANRQNQDYVEFMLSESISFKEEEDFTDVSYLETRLNLSMKNLACLLM